MKPIIYPYVVVKTFESGSIFTGDRQLSTTIIKTFSKNEYSDFSPRRDHLIKNASVIKNESELEVSGEEIFFMTTGFEKLRFGKRYELFWEVDKNKKKWTANDIQTQIKIHTKEKLKIEDSEIKLGYSNIWDYIKRRKTFYLDASPEVISAFHHTYPKYVQKDKKGFFLDGFYKTTLTTPFKLKTNNYRIEEF